MKKITTGFYKALCRIIGDNGTFFLFTVFITLTIKISTQYITPDSDITNGTNFAASLLLTFVLSLADGLVYCLIAQLIRKGSGLLKWSGMKYLHFVWYVLVCWVLLGELVSVCIYHSMFTVTIIKLILETTPVESSDMLVTTFMRPEFWIILLVVLLLLCLAYVCSKYSRRMPLWAKIISVILIIACLGSQMVSYTRLYKCFTMTSTGETQQVDKMPWLHSPLIRALFGVAFNKVQNKEIEVISKEIDSIKVDSCSRKCPLIVLIIGESHNKYHSSVYYPDYLPTMPRLQKLKAQGSLITYSDAVSSSNITSDSFKEMFSTINTPVNAYKRNDNWTQHAVFPAVFKKAGYNVYFISNQFVIYMKEFWSSVGGSMVTDASLSKKMFTARNTETCQYDMDLLKSKEYPTLKQLKEHPSLLIVHLLGDHVEYVHRYPKNMEVFTAKDARNPYSGEAGKKVEAEYANALHYTDMVIDSILRQYRNEDMIGIYLSDHGEEVYDWRDNAFRTHEKPVLPEIARYQYDIPLMFYMTDKFKESHPDIAESVRKYSNRPFISRYLPNLLFGLAGIGYKDYDARYDLLSPKYNTKLKRIINTDEDYDALVSKLPKVKEPKN